jgi:outer membrane receptor protein involved in Fe transport
MSSNPTYDEQINQFDERWTFGGHVGANRTLLDSIDINYGGDFRYDDVSRVGVNFFESGEFIAENGNNSLTEASVGTYVEVTWVATDNLRITPGLRADYFDFNVTALNSISAEGNETDSLVSPKFGLAYTISNDLEAYVNWGYGFHSNDARGVVDNTNPVEGLARGEGYEFGGRYQGKGFKPSGG